MIALKNADFKALACVLGENEKSIDEELAHLSALKLKIYKENMGIKRHFSAAQNSFASDLALKALKEALNLAKLDKNELSALLVLSQTPDYLVPGLSQLVHKEANLNKNCLCMDTFAFCSGFLQGLFQALLMLENDKFSHIALVCVSTKSKKLDPSDKLTNSTISDSATALIVSKSNAISPCFFTQKSFTELALKESLPCSLYKKGQSEFIKIDNNCFFNAVQTHFPALAKQFLKEINLNKKDLKFILHSSNELFSKKLLQSLEIDSSQYFNESLSEFGNLDINNLAFNLALMSENVTINENLLARGGGFEFRKNLNFKANKASKLFLASFGTGLILNAFVFDFDLSLKSKILKM